MKRGKIKNRLFVFAFCAIASWLALWSLVKLEADELVERVPFNKEIKSFLMKRLVKVVPFSPRPYNKSFELDRVIYVMGGAQESLEFRLKTAANLYQNGASMKLLIPSQPGITRYDPAIGRNLTRNEWALRQLVDSGVKAEDIELISTRESFFGTFAEARQVSALVLKRDYKHLILVTSPSHTKRAWTTFSRFLERRDIRFHIYASKDDSNLRRLLFEYIKYIVYRGILLPVYFNLFPELAPS